jgi:hypothetical protein
VVWSLFQHGPNPTNHGVCHGVGHYPPQVAQHTGSPVCQRRWTPQQAGTGWIMHYMHTLQAAQLLHAGSLPLAPSTTPSIPLAAEVSSPACKASCGDAALMHVPREARFVQQPLPGQHYIVNHTSCNVVTSPGPACKRPNTQQWPGTTWKHTLAVAVRGNTCFSAGNKWACPLLGWSCDAALPCARHLWEHLRRRLHPARTRSICPPHSPGVSGHP